MYQKGQQNYQKGQQMYHKGDFYTPKVNKNKNSNNQNSQYSSGNYYTPSPGVKKEQKIYKDMNMTKKQSSATSKSFLSCSPEPSIPKESKNTFKDSKNTIKNMLSSPRSNRRSTLSDFKSLKTLGEGKFGTVSVCLHLQTGFLYAVKKIKKQMIRSHLMVEQLMKEIKIQSFCSDQNIVRLYDCFDDQ